VLICERTDILQIPVARSSVTPDHRDEEETLACRTIRVGLAGLEGRELEEGN
jgi:hypothetical protein